MSSTKGGGYRIALASLVVAGLYCGAAGAAGVSERSVGEMDQWYGRAGGPAPTDSVSAAHVPQQGSKAVGVGVPANSGSLLYDEAGGGIRSNPNIRSNEAPIQVGLPANSGSLLYDEAGGGIRSEPKMRSSGQEEAKQPTASLPQGSASTNTH